MAIKVKNLYDDTTFMQMTTLGSTGKEDLEEETFELGLSYVKRRKKAFFLSVGRESLIIGHEDEEKGVMHPLRLIQ